MSDNEKERANEKPPTLLLIHGTFAYASEDSGAAWWQRGSEFHAWLSLTDARRYDCQPASEIFRWSGNNLESDRRRAAERLSEQIQGYERSGRKYAIIAHSHGGSVAHHALALAHRAVPGLPNLIRLVTVGTPFLSFELDLSPWILLLPLLASGYFLVFITVSLSSPYYASLSEFVMFKEWEYLILVPCLLAIIATTFLYLTRTLVSVALNQIRQISWRRAHRSLGPIVDGRLSAVFAVQDEAIAAVSGTLALGGEALIPWPRTLRFGGVDAILATVGNQYVLERLNTHTQGADLIGLRLGWVAAAPHADATPAWLDDEASQTLIAHANATLTGSVTAVRSALAYLGWNAGPLSYIKNAGSGAGLGKGLIHTSYFAVPEVRAIIAKALLGDAPHPGPARLVPPLKKRRRIFLPMPLFLTRTLAAGTVAFVPFLLSLSYLRPLDNQRVVRAAVDQAPVPSASWEIEQGPPEAVRLIARLAARDQIAGFASKLSQSSNPLRMYSELALGLADRGLADFARHYVDEAKQYVEQRGTAEIDRIGPSLAVEKHLKTYAQALARLGTMVELDDFVVRATSRIDGAPASVRAADELRAEAAAGFVASGKHAAAREEFNRITDRYIKRDAILALIAQSTETTIIESFLALMGVPDLRQDLVAELISDRSLTLPIVDLARLLSSLDRAAPRAIATSKLAERLGRDGKVAEAVALVEADLSAFDGRERDPLEGLRIHYVRYASALLALGQADRARAILQFAEALPPEKIDDTTYSDFSGPDRAVLWARLGNPAKAIALAHEDAGLHQDLFREIGRDLRNTIGEDAVARATGAVADPLERVRMIVGMLDHASIGSARARILRELLVHTRSVIDPQTKSAMLAEIAKGWIRIDGFRRALDVATTTRSYHSLEVIADMVTRYYDPRSPPRIL